MTRSPLLPGGEIALTGVDLPDGALILAVHHVGRDDAVLVRSAIRGTTGRRPWLGLVMPTRSVPWGTSARSQALAVLRQSGLVVLFPENAIAPGDGVFKGDVEVAHLALETGVPVVPAVISGDRGALRVGEPMDFSRHAETPHSRAVLRAVTDEVMEAISTLAGLPYRDIPAPAARQEASAARRDRSRARRAHRAAARQQLILERQEVRAQAAVEAADLAQAAILARERAKVQAREAALADRLRAAGITPGVIHEADRPDEAYRPGTDGNTEDEH